MRIIRVRLVAYNAGVVSMLGHLVYNRTADRGGDVSPVLAQTGWMRRLLRALFGRKH